MLLPRAIATRTQYLDFGIRHARLIDGSGAPAISGDIAAISELPATIRQLAPLRLRFRSSHLISS